MQPVFNASLKFIAVCSLAAQAMMGFAQSESPKYGGTLQVATIYANLPPLSWDLADRNWKQNHDTGQVYEQLFAADLSKSKRNGGPYAFVADAWLPSDAIRGELAESWTWKDKPLTLEVKLRQGIKFPAKPGVMAERELVADDVIFNFNRQINSPKRNPGYYDHLEKVVAVDKYTVLFQFKEFNSEWDYRFGWGYFSGILPKEVVAAGAGNWKNINGTGPFMLADYIQGNSSTYAKNPAYWDKERIGGKDFQLPFVDKLIYRAIKDESTQYSAIRTAKVDILESIRWEAVEELKKSAPQLKWNRWLSFSGQALAMRVDMKPFDDIRVRRAMNLAVNKQEIVKAFYGGNAEVFAFPQHPDYEGYFEPLSAMPDSIKMLYTQDLVKARQLLAEAGYPNGFTFKTQVNAANAEHMELLPLIASYLERIGVKMQIQPLEYAAYMSVMSSKTHAPGYMLSTGHTNPTTTIRKNFIKDQTWNVSQWTDATTEKLMDDAFLERDEGKRRMLIRQVTRHTLEQSPYLWLPTPYVYSAWWPWVKNYGGELRAGAVRPGPIYARIWIDQELKKKMGF